ncbi:MAG: hypothetical protein WAN10_07390 [Candidatus Acidiferrales bacterium]
MRAARAFAKVAAVNCAAMLAVVVGTAQRAETTASATRGVATLPASGQAGGAEARPYGKFAAA